MLGRLFRTINHRADELLIVAVVLVGAAIFYMPGVMDKLTNSGFAPSGAESTEVREAISEKFDTAGADVIVLVKSRTAAHTSPEFLAAAKDVNDQIAKHEGVGSVTGLGAPQLAANDGKGQVLLVTIPGELSRQEEVAASLRDSVKSDNLELAFAGEAILNHDITQQISTDLALAETISFALLAVLLVLVFRGVVAALLPLLLGGFSVLVSFLVLRGLVEVTSVVEYALNVIILIGLGLAVDYSLLMVSRFREELVAQKGDVQEALRVTMQTAGRTIFFSGLTVIISLLALAIFPLDFLRSMGLGGAAAVFVAMGGALVVLPSMLRLLGHRVNWLSFGRAKKMAAAARDGGTHTEKESVWYKTGALFMRLPVLVIIVTLGLLLAGGMPFLRAKLATPDHTVLPEGAQARVATESLRSDFAFSADPIKVLYVTDRASVQDPQAQEDIAAYLTELKKIEGVRSAAVSAVSQGKEVAIDVGFEPGAMSSEAQNLVKTLRASNPPNAAVTVGGATAELVDLLAVLMTHIPYALAIIGVTLFILLFLMLGSVVLPLVAMVQNVLSLAVAFGALVWIFQEGNMADVLRMNVTGSIDATQPVLIFAVAFGLSMDYSVFLYGRIKEEYDRTRDNDTAVLNGLQKTGSIITSAAILLFVVVAAFATSRISIMQQVGVGLALAILVDAFLVRMVLVPATMKLLGKFNWWAPSALKRLQARFGFSD